MAALRAMLQIRSTDRTSIDQQRDSLDIDHHPYHTSHSTPGSAQSSSVQSLSTGSSVYGHHHHPSSSQSNYNNNNNLTSSISSVVGVKSTTPAKKPTFIVNLGLHSGAASGNLGLVKFALDNGQPIDSVVNGVYAIHAACCNNNVAVVLYLIEHGADVNARRLPRKNSPEKGVQTVGTTGSTPLHFAAANGCLNVVDILLRHGAIVDMTDKYGTSPLSVAAARKHPEVASLLHQYSSMQRGVQDLTPDTEIRDPWPERRGSTESNRRGATVVTPTPSSPSTSTATSARSSPTGHSKDPSAQSLPATATSRGNYSTTRVAGQRRISLPSITESPSSPNIPAPPRQSCDFGRTPQSTEPLIRTTSSLRSTNSQPTRNKPNNLTISSRPSMDVSRPSMDMSRPSVDMTRPSMDMTRPSMDMTRPSMDMLRPSMDMSRPSMDSHRRQEPARRGMQRSHTTQDGEQQRKPLGESGDTPAMKRRKSMESAKFLSPHSAMTSVSRRKSFDQLSSLRDPDPKSRRSSSASSTASQNTGSSATSGTTNTSMSEHTPDSTSASMAPSGYPQQLSGSEIKALYLSGRTDSGNASMLPSPLTRSISQPVIEQIKPRRPPVSFASEPVVRQSLDVQRLAMNQERANESERLNGLLKNDSDSDLPGQLFRRRTMQEPILNPSRLSILPRHHSMGPSGNMETRSTPTSPDEMPGSGKGSHYQQQHHTLSSSQDSSKSLQDIAAPRLSTSSISSLSGSSTVGRFSRMWSSSASSAAAAGGKENSAPGVVAGNWNVGEFGEASAEAAAQSLARPELNRTRGGSGGGGMLNRLSGIWSRR
ncbi:hypothetical protein KI688_010998 [Linnemannia hyalina]|uniref:Ankyrin n=1 Tax=Linnemannia hyalina TaxID=64524 RepID=A0A9P7XWM1_9FUNG|nr:hypothetical protein KI688_010998 [Linnemannia hyalina]